ncbi:HAMP domain-containing protein [Leucothrix sargassi]|nr:HAMP domain-containing protein [Leucothrix sargassi]
MKGFVLKIFHKVLLGNLLVVLVPLAGLAFLIDRAQNDQLETIENELRLEASSIERDIDRWAEMNRRMLTQNSLNADITSMETSRQTPILENILNTYEWVFLVYTVDENGYMTARSDDKNILNDDGTPAHFRGDRGYFKAIANGETFGQSVVMSRTINLPVYVLCVPLGGTDSGRKDMICTASKLEDVSQTVANLKLGSTGYAFLTSKADKLIASGEFSSSAAEGLQDMSDHPTIANSQSKQLYTFDQDGKKVVSYSVDAGFGWRLVVQQDYDEIFQSVTDAKKNAWTFLGLTIAAIALLAMFFSRELSRSIRKLTDLADDYSKGLFDKPNGSLTRRDEIGDLSRAIDRMGKSIRIAMSKLSDKKP